MAFVYADRVKELTTTENTASFVMGGAPTGHQPFSVIENGNSCYYCADDYAGNWEVGYGVYTTANSTLTRTNPPIASSNTGALVPFGIGSKYVTLIQPAIEVGANAIHRDTANGKMYRIVVSNGNVATQEVTSL